MADPHCLVCGGNGMLTTGACHYCPPAPCVACVGDTLVAVLRAEREKAEDIRPCPWCDQPTFIGDDGLCAPCQQSRTTDLELMWAS